MTTTESNGWLLKIAAGVITTLLTLAIAAIAANLATLNREMIELQAWREQVVTSATVPRTEADLREKILSGNIEQNRLRIEVIERQLRQ